MLNGLARHEKRPIVPCLGRRPGTKPVAARHGRPVGPWRPVQYRAVPARGRAGPGRAGPLAIYTDRIGGKPEAKDGYSKYSHLLPDQDGSGEKCEDGYPQYFRKWIITFVLAKVAIRHQTTPLKTLTNFILIIQTLKQILQRCRAGYE